MKSNYSFIITHKGEKYGVASIDFNNEKVNLNGGEVIELNDTELELFIAGKSFRKGMLEIPINVGVLFNGVINDVKNKCYFDDKNKQFVISIDKVCSMISAAISDFEDKVLK